MSSLKEKLLEAVKIATLALVIVLGVNYLYAQTTWVNPPTGTAPSNCVDGYQGCNPPIHNGSAEQYKNGNLYLGVSAIPNPDPNYKLGVTGDVGISGNLSTTGFTLQDGNQGAGKVLMDNGDGTGKAQWTTPSFGNVKVYSSTTNTTADLTGSSLAWQTIVASPVITPMSANSKFLIIANAVADNGSADGVCQIGLFRDGPDTQYPIVSMALLAPYADRDQSSYDVSPSGVTYVDPAYSTDQRKYVLKARPSVASGHCYINRDQGNLWNGYSTISVLEIPQ